jgi:MarR family transcriptional regulator, organic hydroperoxide resistance regulator
VRAHEAGCGYDFRSGFTSLYTVSLYNPASPDFVKEEFPFYWLARVHGVYSMQMERALKTVGLDVPTWRTLFILNEHGNSSMSEISLHAIAKLSTVTKIVYRMKAEGLVETATSQADARVTIVELTDKGREAIERSKLAIQHIFMHSFDGLTPLQIRKLNEFLRTILDNLSPRHAEIAEGRVASRAAQAEPDGGADGG